MSKITVSNRNTYKFLDHTKKMAAQGQTSGFQIQEANRLISSLSNSSAFGHNRLDALAFKAAITNLQRPVQHLVNLFLRQSKSAMKWKA